MLHRVLLFHSHVILRGRQFHSHVRLRRRQSRVCSRLRRMSLCSWPILRWGQSWFLVDPTLGGNNTPLTP